MKFIKVLSIILSIILILIIVIVGVYAVNFSMIKDYYHIKSVISKAIKEDMKTYFLIITDLKIIEYNDDLMCRATVVFPEKWYYEVVLEYKDENWNVVYCGKDI